MKLFIGLVVGALIGLGAGLQVGKWAILDLQKAAVAGILQVERACPAADSTSTFPGSGTTVITVVAGYK